MAKLLDPKAPVRFQPDGEHIAFLFRLPNVMDRAAFARESFASGARRHSPFAMLDALSAGVGLILGDPSQDAEREEVQGGIAAVRQRLVDLAERGRAPEIDKGEILKDWLAALGDPRLAEIEAVVAPAYPLYRAMQGDNAVYMELRGIAACRLFLIGWEGIDGAPKRGLQGLSDESLALVPPHLFPAVAEFVEGLFEPVGNEEKN